MKYGERDVMLTVERDFENRTEYDAYKALTAQSITMVASKTADKSITFLMPVGVKESYEVSGLTGQADLIRASVSYRGVYDSATSKAYQIVVKSTENVTYP
jgi:hypothetical protein